MNNKAIITGEDILKLLPQRAPILMVDKFYGIEDNESRSGLTITADNIFCSDGELQETGIIEHIAQSAAARVGYIYVEKGEEVPLGFIGSVDKLTLHYLPKVGEELTTTISIMQEVGDITLVSAQTLSGDTVVADCRMKIFLKKDA